MTCKDCYMHDVCKDWARDCFGKDTTFPYEAEKNFCKFYKDKSRIVELPCKLGDELNDEIVHEIDFREFESQGEVRREGFVHTMNKEDLDSIVFCSHPIPWEKAKEALRKAVER